MVGLVKETRNGDVTDKRLDDIKKIKKEEQETRSVDKKK